MKGLIELLYVPILHTQKETGQIIASLKGGVPEEPSISSTVKQEVYIKEMWDGISEKIEKSNISYSQTRIYQDALPVCGRESEIIEKLANRGSLNHQLISKLMKKGARLEGTEDPDLLIKEYDYLRMLLNAISTSDQSYRVALKEYEDKSMKLMIERDGFVAKRIKETIKKDETPLVFMGVRHQLEKLLKEHFVITYIIYRLPFKKVKDIYNV